MCHYLVNHRKFSNFYLEDAVAVGTGMPYIATYVYGSLKNMFAYVGNQLTSLQMQVSLHIVLR